MILYGMVKFVIRSLKISFTKLGLILSSFEDFNTQSAIVVKINHSFSWLFKIIRTNYCNRYVKTEASVFANFLL